jgi:PGAP1-like protein
MANILVIHGIGQETQGPSSLHARFFPALRDGLSLAGKDVAADSVAFASYGEFFRPESEFLAPDLYYDESHVEPGYEQDLLLALWQRAADCDPAVLPPAEEVLGRTPTVVRRALAALSRSHFLAGIVERTFIGDLKQVSTYFRDESMRAKIQNRVASAIEADTQVVIGHSLGSVVAYEALCANSYDQVNALITLGSPLGLRNLVFDRLKPAPTPTENGRLKGAWPSVRMWGNVADTGDIVAAIEDLRPQFGDQISQLRVHNGAKAHDMSPYLTDRRTGELIIAGLAA